MGLYRLGCGEYQSEYDQLSRSLVPSAGLPDTMQGEAVRAIGRLTLEYYENENRNWDSELDNLGKSLGELLRDADVFSAALLDQIDADVYQIRYNGNARKCNYVEGEDEYDRVIDRIVEWCQYYSEPIPNLAKVAYQLLHEELEARGIAYQRREDDLYDFRVGGITVTRRFGYTCDRFKATGDPTCVTSFVDSLDPDTALQVEATVTSIDDSIASDATFDCDAEVSDAASVFVVDVNVQAQEIPLPVPRVTKAMLSQEGFLRDAMVLPLGEDVLLDEELPDRALFLGMYGLRFFDSLQSFGEFTTFMAPATPQWYLCHDVDEAISFVSPFAEWPTHQPGRKGAGGIRYFLLNRKLPIRLSAVPALYALEYEWSGGGSDFRLIARCRRCWLDLFVANWDDWRTRGIS
jgi:hypothetical protein